MRKITATKKAAEASQKGRIVALTDNAWAVIATIRGNPYIVEREMNAVRYTFRGTEKAMAERLVAKGLLKRRRNDGDYDVTALGNRSFEATKS